MVDREECPIGFSPGSGRMSSCFQHNHVSALLGPEHDIKLLPFMSFFVFQLSQCDVGLDFPFMPNVVVLSVGGFEDTLFAALGVPEECRDDCTDGPAGSSHHFCWRVVSCTT